jgi:predicted NUDIX family NTP pyrophosphohydrolase
MPKQSAGLLLYRTVGVGVEVFLVHPGGPFWAKKDVGAWSIPKGEFAVGEAPLAAAQREVREETGCAIAGPFRALGSVRQPGGKTVHAFAAPADLDPGAIVSNRFTLEWPPRSGQKTEFPEIDRAAWFAIDVAANKIHPAQREFLTRLTAALAVP